MSESLNHSFDFGPRFEVRGEVGRGAQGSVVRAWDRTTNRMVALKRAPESATPKQLARLEREAESLAQVATFGIVRVHALERTPAGAPFLVMDLVEGGRTFNKAFPATAPLAERLSALAEAARAVGHAHEHQIVHRDLKPSNLLVDPDGRVRVCDFGLAFSSSSERLTQTGEFLGTPAYMAPESLGGKDLGTPQPSGDVWSLGVMLYEILVGRLPYESHNSLLLLQQIATLPPPPPSTFGPVSKPLETLCLQALSRDPEDRPQNGSAFAIALETARAKAGQEPRLPGWLLGLVLCGTLGVGAWLSMPSSPTPSTHSTPLPSEGSPAPSLPGSRAPSQPSEAPSPAFGWSNPEVWLLPDPEPEARRAVLSWLSEDRFLISKARLAEDLLVLRSGSDRPERQFPGTPLLALRRVGESMLLLNRKGATSRLPLKPELNSIDLTWSAPVRSMKAGAIGPQGQIALFSAKGDLLFARSPDDPPRVVATKPANRCLLAFSEQGEVAFASARWLTLWDSAQGVVVHAHAFSAVPKSLAWSGDRLLVATHLGRILVYRREGSQLRELSPLTDPQLAANEETGVGPAHLLSIQSLAAHKGLVYSAGAREGQGWLGVWRLDSGALLRKVALEGHKVDLHVGPPGVLVSSDAKRVFRYPLR